MSQGLMTGDATNAGILTMPAAQSAIAAMFHAANDPHPSPVSLAIYHFSFFSPAGISFSNIQKNPFVYAQVNSRIM